MLLLLLAKLQLHKQCPLYLQDGDEHNTIEEARTNDGAFFQVLPWEELHGGILFPEVECWDAENTQYFHGNDVATGPSVGSVCCDAEGKQDQGEGGSDENYANHFERISTLLKSTGSGKGLPSNSMK